MTNAQKTRTSSRTIIIFKVKGRSLINETETADKKMAKFLKLIMVTRAPNANAFRGVMLSMMANRRGLLLFSDGGFRQLFCVSQRSNRPKMTNRSGKSFPGSRELFSVTV